nr:uncharacterized protein LOC109162950 isoform X1 [Ipomoea batatas]GMD95670.1 uncharacterized protein LOC109162950 isoform X1 [Ipomoea batatas]GME04011.1 uncharacterized protein LOC109162950 isoform X1 [Ipomoea batatas]
MASTRKQKIRKDSRRQTLDSASDSKHSRPLNKLLSAIKTPEGIKSPILKSLYCLLVHMSTDSLSKVDVNDLRVISDILFKELSLRFNSLFSSLYDVCTSKDLGQGSIHMNCTVEVLVLLLRCCMAILQLHIYDHNVVLEKGGILLKILCKLCSLNLPKRKDRKDISLQNSVFHACTYDDDDFTTTSREELVASLHFYEPPNLQTSFAIAMLEVFLDELLVHGKLRAIFRLIDLFSSTSETLFMPQSTQKDISSKKRQSDIGILMELVSTCFLLSFSGENAIEDFLYRLFRAQRKDFKFFKTPDVSLTGAISLLLNPIVFSAPKIVQAYVVSSVSEAMSGLMDVQNLKPNCKLLDCFLSVFEKSVHMYMKLISFVQINGDSPSKCAPFVNSSTYRGNFPPPFESYILPSTQDKINSLIKRFEGSSDSFLGNHFFELKSDMTSSCIAYVKDCQCLLDQSCQDDVFSIISCLILRASVSFDETVIPAIKGMDLQSICLLVAVLKSMGTSLLHAISYLQNGESYGSFKTLKDYSLCKEYMSILGSISCFSESKIHFPVQQFLCNIMETNSIKHKDFMVMLLHFSGMLAFSFLKRIGCLAYGCLLTITALVNLFVLEEGYLDELRSLIVSGSDSDSSALPLVRIQEAVMDQRPSIMVASKFQNIQNLYLSKSKTMVKYCGSVEDGWPESSSSSASCLFDKEEEMVSVEEETLNGEMFLRCMEPNAKKDSDFGELADFIECKQGKDYAEWLQDREKYRKWKCKRTAMLRWKRKRKTWKVWKGKSSSGLMVSEFP